MGRSVECSGRSKARARLRRLCSADHNRSHVLDFSVVLHPTVSLVSSSRPLQRREWFLLHTSACCVPKPRERGVPPSVMIFSLPRARERGVSSSVTIVSSSVPSATSAGARRQLYVDVWLQVYSSCQVSGASGSEFSELGVWFHLSLWFRRLSGFPRY